MNSLNNSLETLFGKMENFISTKTVVGEPVHIGNVILVPLVDVMFGVGAGGGEKPDDKDREGGGGLGMGAKITPSAVIVIVDGTAQLVNVKNQDSVNKLIDMVPGILSKLNLGSIFKNSKDTEHQNAEKVIFKETRVTETVTPDMAGGIDEG